MQWLIYKLLYNVNLAFKKYKIFLLPTNLFSRIFNILHIALTKVICPLDKSEIDKPTSTKTTDSWNGKRITLRCMFSGNPSPRVTWYKPTGTELGAIVARTAYEGRVFVSEVNTTTRNNEDYGKYRCLVTNVVGNDEYYIMVNQLCK
jgi:hypothetical protein